MVMTNDSHTQVVTKSTTCTTTSNNNNNTDTSIYMVLSVINRQNPRHLKPLGKVDGFTSTLVKCNKYE